MLPNHIEIEEEDSPAANQGGSETVQQTENARGFWSPARVGRRRKTTTTTRIDQLRTFHAQCLRDESIPPPLCTARRPTRTFLRLYNVARRGGVPPSQANRETKEVEVS